MPADTDAALDRYCPDLANWPQAWKHEESDVPIGQSLVEQFKPFLLNLLRQSLSDKTRARHRDHLWMLGGEIIRRRHDDASLARQSVKALLFNLIEEEGGPLIWPRISEPEQKSFDATCRKLYRFLQPGKTR
jgi:hypothetical protein